MADAQASGASYGNIVWVQVPSPASQLNIGSARKCRNWQTSKTKDLVVGVPCGVSRSPIFRIERTAID